MGGRADGGRQLGDFDGRVGRLTRLPFFFFFWGGLMVGEARQLAGRTRNNHTRAHARKLPLKEKCPNDADNDDDGTRRSPPLLSGELNFLLMY